MLKVLILVSFCFLFSWLFASLVEGEWINPFANYKNERERKKIDARWRAAEAAYELEQERKWQEWQEEKKRRAAQAIETKKRQAVKAAKKAAKRAAHEARTLANKKRKEESKIEYSLRKWGVPPY